LKDVPGGGSAVNCKTRGGRVRRSKKRGQNQVTLPKGGSFGKKGTTKCRAETGSMKEGRKGKTEPGRGEKGHAVTFQDGKKKIGGNSHPPPPHFATVKKNMLSQKKTWEGAKGQTQLRRRGRPTRERKMDMLRKSHTHEREKDQTLKETSLETRALQLSGGLNRRRKSIDVRFEKGSLTSLKKIGAHTP